SSAVGARAVQAVEAANALAETQNESSPAIEPSPIPGAAAAAKAKTKIAAAPPIVGMEVTAPTAQEPAPSRANTQPDAAVPGSIATGTAAKPEEIPTSPSPNFSPVVETPVAAAAAPASAAVPAGHEQPAVAESQPAVPAAGAKPPVGAAAPPATPLGP